MQNRTGRTSPGDTLLQVVVELFVKLLFYEELLRTPAVNHSDPDNICTHDKSRDDSFVPALFLCTLPDGFVQTLEQSVTSYIYIIIINQYK